MGKGLEALMSWAGSLNGVPLFVALWEWGVRADGSFLLPGPHEAPAALLAFDHDKSEGKRAMALSGLPSV